MSEQKTSSRDFVPIKLLGKGAFGAVLLVNKVNGDGSGQQFALKVMKKRSLAKQKAINVARIEREVLAVVRHPYLVGLCYAFQSRSRLYLVTEYLRGGSLEDYLKIHRRLSREKTSVVAAQLTLGVEHLHALGVIHRDIKAANVLFNARGDACLADFGLAAYCDDAASKTSFCGTIEYMAPELFRKTEGYTAAVDYWSLGVLIYEMIVGVTPFQSRNPRTLFENILKAQPVFEDATEDDDDIGWSTDFTVCVRALLERDAGKRPNSQTLRTFPALADAFDALSNRTPRGDQLCSGRDDEEEMRESAQGYMSEGRGTLYSNPSVASIRADAFAGFAFCQEDQKQQQQQQARPAQVTPQSSTNSLAVSTPRTPRFSLLGGSKLVKSSFFFRPSSGRIKSGRRLFSQASSISSQHSTAG